MATVVNFMDVTLRGAAARTVNLASAQILLTASAPAFHVDAAGVITPPTITFTATLIDLDAPLTFNATGAPLANVTAKSVTVAGSAMTGSSVTVIASATVNGQTYTGPCTISKFSDGKDGQNADGSNLTPGDLKAILEGQLTTDELDAALRTRISLIDGGADMAGSVTARVKAETDARIAAITQQTSDYRTYVQQYTYSQQSINDSFSAFGTNIQAAYQGYANNAADNALAAAKSFAQTYAYSKADSDSSLTATANQLRSEFATLNQGAGATVAWVQEYAYSKAQVNDAIASSTQQLSTTVAGHTTTIETQTQSINGLSGQYSVKVDNNNYVSGFGLASTPINGVPTSSFIVLADRFAVALPGQPAKYPFAIGKVAGQTTITFNGNIIADGSFTFRDAAGKVLLSVGVPLDPSLAAPGTLNSEVTLPSLGQHTYRVVTQGNGNTVPLGNLGLFLNGVRKYDVGTSYTLIVIRRTDEVVVLSKSYNLITGGNTAAASLASDLNNVAAGYVAVLYSFDEAQSYHDNPALVAAVCRCGGSRAVFGSSSFRYRSAYILVGYGGIGEGNGIEKYAGDVDSDPNAWCEVSFTMLNGNIVSSPGSTTPSKAIAAAALTADWSGVVGAGKPQDNATVGATIGQNLLGKFNKSNISTFIEAAAIGLALIDKASITNLAALNAYLGSAEIGPGGNLRQGQTAFHTGTGFWLGDSGGVPKFSIGKPGTSSLRWDGTKLVQENVSTESSFSAGIHANDNSYYHIVGRNINPAVIGNFTADTANGIGPYTYSWSVSTMNGVARGWIYGATNGQQAQLAVYGAGLRTEDGSPFDVDFYVQCIVTDRGGNVVRTVDTLTTVGFT